MTNNDSSACGSATFNLQSVVPSGWSGKLGSSALTISPGSAGSTTLTVTSTITASALMNTLAANAYFTFYIGAAWTPTSVAGINITPYYRRVATAVWTGSEMVVWGGLDNSGSGTNYGAKYNPTTDSWITTSTGTGNPSPRYNHTAVWTGSEMIIWGGQNSGNYLNTGAKYNPSTDAWTTTSTGTNVPAGRWNHTLVWTGSEMIIWGGMNNSGTFTIYNTGGKYNPTTDSWTITSTGSNVPTARYIHTAVWTGTEMIVWGGRINSTWYNTGGKYNPSSDSWTTTSTGTNVPSVRDGHTAIWTGTEMILWGGGTYTNTGGKYNPVTDTWIATSLGSNVPSARAYHTAVWTGSQMIIWSGYNGGPTNTGGVYSP